VTDVVIIRPKSDPVETTLSMWADLLFPPGTGQPGVAVVQDLIGPKATPSAVQGTVGAADVILFFGHGTETSLGIPTLLDKSSFSARSNQVVIAIACSSSDDLGPSIVVQNGAAAYLGFTEPLFVYNASPGILGFQIARRLTDYLANAQPLWQTRDGLEADFKLIEQLYRTGPRATHPDAPLIWMGIRMNWRGLALD